MEIKNTLTYNSLYQNTNFFKITDFLREAHEWLGKISSSPITELNRAVAILQAHGASAALTALESRVFGTDKKKMETFYLYHSLLGEIYSRLNNPVEAKKRFETAIKLTQSETEKKLLKEKVGALLKRF